jgi:hypothetical protein
MSDAKTRTTLRLKVQPPKGRVGSQRVYLVRGPKGRIDSRPIGNPRQKGRPVKTSADYKKALQRLRRVDEWHDNKHELPTAKRRQADKRRLATQKRRRTALMQVIARRARTGNPNPRKRRSRPMAKLHGAAKAAFLARMARGRRAARTRNPASLRRAIHTGGPPVSPQVFEDHRWLSAEGRRKNPMTARNHSGQFVSVANPGRPFSQVPRSYGKGWAKPKRKRAKARRSQHPKKRKVSRARRSTARIEQGSGRGRRRYPYQVTFRTPKKHGGRRVKNPSFRGVMASIKTTAMPMALGGLAGLGSGFLDAKIFGTKPTLSILSKIGLALLGAGLIGQKHPMAAAGWAGGMIGSTGYHQGVKWGGGMVGLSPSGALAGIADMAADDPEMAQLIAGLGDVVDAEGVGDVEDEYNTALADADDMDDVGDLVEAEG